ncbi:LacI family transcriptional regulator [Lachnotalea glycerini]|uniref:LacI family transcriptional regulator n=1 Tax=Lachnotalea glycerini TaxID=1763509 RepID=A0A318EI55_9FIRM|nr:LacI family DNA-binding transcriptional regulator [Lachnotalea glycerini]PXV86645.1 LacI family transcriptional regulator [Lachnotalea glycerini]
METITIKDIAKMCGVGVSTVSRAINDHPDINQETKNIVMQVIKENNYIPNNSARNLKRSDSRTIAVLIKGISNPFFSSMIKIFENEIQRKKYSFVLHRVEEQEDEIDVAVELVKEKRLRGIVFLGGHFTHTAEKLEQVKVPFVLSTIGVKENNLINKGFACVAVDDFKESYKMVDYLCKNGHKKIAIISSSISDESIGKRRLEGYKKALEDNHIFYNMNLVRTMREDIETYTMKNGYEVTKDLLESNEEFTAIYAISDSLAIGACRAIMEAGKNVPNDYSVAGFDGLEIGLFYNPSLTTIRQPVEEMAFETIKMLFDLINKKTTPDSKIFPAKLVIAESTRKI